MTREIEFQLREPLPVLVYQAGRLPIEVTLQELTVYREYTEVFALGLEIVSGMPTPPVDKIKGQRTTTGSIIYEFGESMADLSIYAFLQSDAPVHLMAPGILVENCYLSTNHYQTNDEMRIYFLAQHLKYDPKHKKGTEMPIITPPTKADRWRLMEEFECIAQGAPLWPGDLISKKRAKILEDQGLVMRDEDGNFVLTPNGSMIYKIWNKLPEQY